MSSVSAEIVTALRARKLLVVWAEAPLALSEREPANRVVAINQLIEQARQLPAISALLSALPSVTILSLDPTGRVEQAFKAAGVALRVVKTRQDVLAREAHNLIKLGGDLASRAGVVLSREGVRDLLSDTDKRYLLDEAQRIAREGAVIVIGADADNPDFQVWWNLIQPRWGEASVFTLGGEMAGATSLTIDFATLSAELKEVMMAGQSEAKTAAPGGGDVVGGDKVGGDKVMGDKITAGRDVIMAAVGATVIVHAGPAAAPARPMDADRASLQYQLDQARENLRLVEELISQYVMSTDVNPQYIKQQRQWQARIAELEQLLAAL